MSSLSIASSPSPSSAHLSRSASTSSSLVTPKHKKTEKVHAQDLEEIERQWARFRRQNAKATEKIAAEEFHQQRIKQEEERVRKAYEDLMACSDADDSARRKRQKKNLKTAAALMMGGKSFANNQNTKQSPPPSPPPQAILLTVSSDTTNRHNDQHQQQTRSRGPSFNKAIDNNSLSVSDMTYNNNNNNNNSLSARPRSLSSVSNNNNNSFGSQQRRRSSTTTSIGQGGARREPSLPKIDLNDPATRKAVRLIERKIRAFLQNKAKAERQVELERAAADSFADASLRGWRNEVWVGATLMRPRYQLPSSVVANIEMQRRHAEGKLRAGIERLKAAEEYQEKTSAYLSGNNRQWVHDHLVRSADRFAKRQNRPVLTSMDIAEQHLMMSPFSRQQQKWR